MNQQIHEPSNEMAALAGAYEDGDIPKIWTPGHVNLRLVELYDVLKRTPVRLRPKAFGSAWPTMVQDYSDLVDAEKLASLMITGQPNTARAMVAEADAEAKRIAEREADEDMRRVRNKPSPAETSRAEEAMCWCLKYLHKRPMLADGIQSWAFCVASDVPLDEFFKARTEIADAKVRRRRWDTLRQIAREIAAWANSRIEKNIAAEWRIKTEAHAEFKDAASKIIIQRRDVWPDRVFTKRWMSTCKKEAAEEIAFRLTRDGVGVR